MNVKPATRPKASIIMYNFLFIIIVVGRKAAFDHIESFKTRHVSVFK